MILLLRIVYRSKPDATGRASELSKSLVFPLSIVLRRLPLISLLLISPFLQGEAAYETIKGLQMNVQATAKHLYVYFRCTPHPSRWFTFGLLSRLHSIANEQERNRTTASSNVDDRTLREIYLHPFMRSVQADVASVMCSYNLLNNT